jgi:hypothetical protein
MFRVRPVVVALCALLVGGCMHQGAAVMTSDVESTPLTADSETIITRTTLNPSQAKRLVLLKIAEDCLAGGFLTFAFTSVGEPKPHLPNQPPDAPPQIGAVQTFPAPTGIVPDIGPGTMVSVKFFKADDPAGADKIFARLIVTNLAPR